MYFIASTFWSTTSYALLMLGGESYLAVGSALVLPMTLLAFIRPVPLPYAWAAPPEPFSHADAGFALAMVLALGVYHAAGIARTARHAARIGPRLHFGGGQPSRGQSWDHGRHGGGREGSVSMGTNDSPSAEGLVGPSLRL